MFGFHVGFMQIAAQNQRAFRLLAKEFDRHFWQEVAACRRVDRAFEVAAGAADDATQQRVEPGSVVVHEQVLQMDAANGWRKFLEGFRLELPVPILRAKVVADAAQRGILMA